MSLINVPKFKSIIKEMHAVLSIERKILHQIMGIWVWGRFQKGPLCQRHHVVVC